MPIHFNWRLELHPLVVHFPIALLCMAFLFDGIGWIWKSQSLRFTGLSCLVAGAIGTGLGVLSGLATPEAQEREGLRTLQTRLVSLSGFFSGRRVEVHKHWGYVLLALVALWLGARVLAQIREVSRPRLAISIGALALVALLITGYSGGELVYDRRGRDRGEAPAVPRVEQMIKVRSSDAPSASPLRAGRRPSAADRETVAHEP